MKKKVIVGPSLKLKHPAEKKKKRECNIRAGRCVLYLKNEQTNWEETRELDSDYVVSIPPGVSCTFANLSTRKPLVLEEKIVSV